MIYRRDHPFCRVREHELKQMQKLADQKKGFDIMLRELKPISMFDRIVHPSQARAHDARKAELEGERDLAVERKKEWWRKIRAKYNVGSKPAIVHMLTGNIILGETKEEIEKEEVGK